MGKLYLSEVTKRSATEGRQDQWKGQWWRDFWGLSVPRGPRSCPQGPALASALGSRVPRGGPGLCCSRLDPRPGSGSPDPGSQAVTNLIRASAFLLENGLMTMAPKAARCQPGCVGAEHRAGSTESVGTWGLDPSFLVVLAQILHTRASRSEVCTVAGPAWGRGVGRPGKLLLGEGR